MGRVVNGLYAEMCSACSPSCRHGSAIGLQRKIDLNRVKKALLFVIHHSDCGMEYFKDDELAELLAGNLERRN